MLKSGIKGCLSFRFNRSRRYTTVNGIDLQRHQARQADGIPSLFQPLGNQDRKANAHHTGYPADRYESLEYESVERQADIRQVQNDLAGSFTNNREGSIAESQHIGLVDESANSQHACSPKSVALEFDSIGRRTRFDLKARKSYAARFPRAARFRGAIWYGFQWAIPNGGGR